MLKFNSYNRKYPDSLEYPTKADWQSFNTSIDGHLLVGHPPGHFCYDPHFDRAKCYEAYTASSSSASILEQPTAIDYPWWGGLGCQPTAGTRGDKQGCGIGNYPNYVVDSYKTEYVQKAVIFARKHNLRLTIKNTGHDFLGRNIGFGSLSIWTRHMKGMRMINDWVPSKSPHAGIDIDTQKPFKSIYKSLIIDNQKKLLNDNPEDKAHTGSGIKAVRIAAGEIFGDANKFVESHKRTIVSGEENVSFSESVR
jgi:hypothetical protein